MASQGLKEGDLVILQLRRPTASAHLPSHTINGYPEQKDVFGYVMQTQRCGSRNSEQLHPLISESNYCSVYLSANLTHFVVELMNIFMGACRHGQGAGALAPLEI